MACPIQRGKANRGPMGGQNFKAGDPPYIQADTGAAFNRCRSFLSPPLGRGEEKTQPKQGKLPPTTDALCAPPPPYFERRGGSAASLRPDSLTART